MPKLRDLTGMTFGRLRVLSRAPSDANKRALWNCECACGARVILKSAGLCAGDTQSCGCQKSEKIAAARTVHDGAETSEYRSWSGMKDRCNNQNNGAYANYGGRGITVCDRWTNSFAAFLADMGPKPTADHSIDRYPNNDGNYEPGNCRWASRTEQNRNRRNVKGREHV